MENRPIFCFIDDSRFELDVFGKNIVPAAPDIDFITGLTYEDVARQLGDRQPILFLLDLYGREEGAARLPIPTQEDLAARIGNFGGLDQVYDGLDDFPGDKVNEYLKRLFHLTDSWRRLFYDASRQAGQSTGYGLANLASVRRDYPFTVAVGYTRKSMIMDAIQLWEAKADGLFLKPDGPSNQAIDLATARAAPGLIQKWSHLVDQKLDSYGRDLTIRLYRAGLKGDLSLASLLETNSALVREALEPQDLQFLRTASSWRNHIDQDG